MRTVYINEFGIRPWESPHPMSDAKFTTTTLVDHDFTSVWGAWCTLMDTLSKDWPIKRQWYSSTNSEFNSLTEEYLFKKDIAKTLKNGDLCKKNESNNIYSTIKIMPSNPWEIENLALEGSHDTILVIQKTETSIEELWSNMAILESRITPQSISILLESQASILLCRFYDTETHAAAQLIYETTYENKIILEQAKNYFNEINTSDIHHYINGTQKS